MIEVVGLADLRSFAVASADVVNSRSGLSYHEAGVVYLWLPISPDDKINRL